MSHARFALTLCVGALMLAPGCDGSGIDANASSLSGQDDSADGAPDRRGPRGGPEEEGPDRRRPPIPEDEGPGYGPDACEDAQLALHACHERAAPVCRSVFDRLERCHAGASAGCETLFADFEGCLERAEDPRRCQPQLEAAEQCAERAHRQCSQEEAAAERCFEMCAEAEADAEAACRPPRANACEHLFMALEACESHRRGRRCGAIVRAIHVVCDLEDEGPGHGPRGELPPPPPEDDEDRGRPGPPDDDGERPEPPRAPPGH